MVEKTFSRNQLKLISELQNEGYNLHDVNETKGIPTLTKGQTTIKITPKTKSYV